MRWAAVTAASAAVATAAAAAEATAAAVCNSVPEQSRPPSLKQTLACTGPSWCQEPSAVVASQMFSACSSKLAAVQLANSVAARLNSSKT
jgi:hypothetical protein